MTLWPTPARAGRGKCQVIWVTLLANISVSRSAPAQMRVWQTSRTIWTQAAVHLSKGWWERNPLATNASVCRNGWIRKGSNSRCAQNISVDCTVVSGRFPVGIPGTVNGGAPGHSPDSGSVVLEQGTALTGGLLPLQHDELSCKRA